MSIYSEQVKAQLAKTGPEKGSATQLKSSAPPAKTTPGTETFTTADGKVLVKTATTGWHYEGGGQPTEREVIAASAALTSQKRATQAATKAAEPEPVPTSQLITELAEQKQDVLAQAEVLRAERTKLLSSSTGDKQANWDKAQSLASQEVALRNESQLLNQLLGGRERSPIAAKGTVSYSKYQQIISRVNAWEALRPFVIGDAKTGNINIDIVSAFENGVGGYRRSSDKTVDQARRIAAVEVALRRAGVSEQTIRQGRLAWYELGKSKATEAKWRAEHTQLGDGRWILNADFEKLRKELTPEQVQIALTQGYEATTKAVQAAWDDAMTFMEQYQIPAMPTGKETTFEEFDALAGQTIPDLYGAVRDLMQTGKFNEQRKYLDTLFGNFEVEKAYKVVLQSMPSMKAADSPIEQTNIPDLNEMSVRERNSYLLNVVRNPETLKPTEEELTTAIMSTRRLTPMEYAWLVKPDNLTDKEYARIAPYITPDSVDVVGAINAGVPDRVIQAICPSCTNQDMAEYHWYAEYEKAPAPKKMVMAVQKDPAGAAKEMGLAAIPVYGSIRYGQQASEGGWTSFEKGMMALSIVGEVLFFVPIIKSVSMGVKAGMPLSRAVMTTARGVIVSPVTSLRRPMQALKNAWEPVENFFKPKAQPIAIVYRGVYSEGMAIPKVGAGAAGNVTREAMEEIVKLATAGKKAQVFIEATGETIVYSPTGLQAILGDTTLHSTPFGLEFIGKGIKTADITFTSPTALYGLTQVSATGQMAGYITDGSDLIATLGKAGKAIDASGNVVGIVKSNSTVVDFYGKTLGKLDDLGNIIRDGKVVAKLGEGRIATAVPSDIKGIISNPKGTAFGFVSALDDKAYALRGGKLAKVVGNNVYDDVGKLIGTVSTDAVKIKKYAPQITLGYLPDNTKIISTVDNTTTIGKLKTSPTFAMIRTEGVRALPKQFENITDMKQLERAVEQWMESGAAPKGSYPVYKQYKQWIEFEGAMPPNTGLMPVLDDAGKPVMLYTRGAGGEKIAMPLMQEVDPDWFDKAVQFTKSLKESVPVNRLDFSIVRRIPNKAAPNIKLWFQKNPKATIYGSFSEYLYGGKAIPSDIDISVATPRVAAGELADIITNTSKVPTRIVKTGTGLAVEILEKGVWHKAIDVNPADTIMKAFSEIPGYKPTFATVDGVKVETLNSQMMSLINRMKTSTWDKAALRFQQLAKERGFSIDIGAQPPTITQLYAMKVRGAWNTIRDIFVKGLTKEKRLQIVKATMPDLADNVDDLIRLEGQLDNARQAEKVTGLTAAEKTRLATARRSIEQGYTELARRLGIEAQARASFMALITAGLPARLTAEARQQYDELLRAEPYSAIEIRLPHILELPGGYRISEYTPAEIARLEAIDRKQARTRTATETDRVTRAGEPTRLEVIVPRVGEYREGEYTERPYVERPYVGRVPKRVPPPPPPPPTRPPRPPRPPRPTTITRPPRTPFLSTSLATGIVEKKPISHKGAVAWKQGRLKMKGGGIGDHWIIIYPPYRGHGEPVKKHVVSDIPPKGVRIAPDAKTAYRTIQSIGKAATATKFTVDMGIMDITVDKPTTEPGKPGAIEFKRDVKQETVSDITMGKGKTRGVRGTSVESLSKLPLHTTLGQLLTIEYKSEPLRQFAKEHSLPKKLRESGMAVVAEVLQQLVAEGKLETQASILARQSKDGESLTPRADFSSPRKLADSYENTIAVIRSMLPTKDALKLDRLLSSARSATLAKVRGYPKPTETTGRITTIRAKQTSKESKLRPTTKPNQISVATARLVGDPSDTLRAIGL